jgi:hypothetical protein
MGFIVTWLWQMWLSSGEECSEYEIVGDEAVFSACD